MPFTIPGLQNIATDAANQYGVPVGVFQWQLGQESSWNPYAQNGDAYGIAQFMPATAREYGVNRSDPVSSIYGAAHYDADLYARYGTWEKALEHYGTISGPTKSALAIQMQSALYKGAPDSSQYSSFADWSADLNKWGADLLMVSPYGAAKAAATSVESGAVNYGKRIAIALLAISLIYGGVITLAAQGAIGGATYLLGKHRKLAATVAPLAAAVA